MEKRQFQVKRSLTLTKKYRSWEEYDIGDIVVGKVVGTHTDKFDKIGYVLEVAEAFFKDKKLASSLAGQNLVLNYTGMMDKAMKEGGVTVGDIVQVEYKGKAEIKKGKYAGKSAHVVDVAVVEEVQEDEL